MSRFGVSAIKNNMSKIGSIAGGGMNILGDGLNKLGDMKSMIGDGMNRLGLMESGD
jgi:hypothetical protein